MAHIFSYFHYSYCRESSLFFILLMSIHCHFIIHISYSFHIPLAIPYYLHFPRHLLCLHYYCLFACLLFFPLSSFHIIRRWVFRLSNSCFPVHFSLYSMSLSIQSCPCLPCHSSVHCRHCFIFESSLSISSYIHLPFSLHYFLLNVIHFPYYSYLLPSYSFCLCLHSFLPFLFSFSIIFSPIFIHYSTLLVH